MSSISKQLHLASQSRALRAKTRGLPPRVESFVNRESLVGQVISVLGNEPTGRRILVHGRPGVGKTAAALEIAHRLVDQSRYDYVVWLDCQRVILSSSSIELSPYALEDYASVTIALSHAVGAIEANGCSTEQRSHVLSSFLSQHRTLLILDGVDKIFDSALRNLLARLPFTVDIIVTCRTTYDWGQPIYVPPFPGNDDSIRQIIRAEFQRRSLAYSDADDVVRRIESASEGIPMTAIWLVALLSRGETLEKIEMDMKNQNLTLSEYYFSEAWQLIAADSAMHKIALILSATPDLGGNGLIAVLEPILEPEVISIALRRLSSLNVLEDSGQAVRLRGAVRDYILARTSESDSDFRQTVLLAIKYLREVSDKALRLADWDQSFMALEATRPTLVAALNLCRDSANNAIRLQGLRLLNNVAYYFYSMGLWDELLSNCRWSQETALSHGDLDSILEVSMTWIVRIIDRRAGEAAAAKFMAQTEIALRGNGGTISPIIQMKLDVTRAVIRNSNGSFAGGIGRLVELGNELWQYDCHEWACRAMLQAGNFASKALDTATADAAFVWVIEHAQRIHAPWAHAMVALSRGNLGILCNRTAKFDRARALLEESIPGLPQLYDIAVAKSEMARACFESGHIRQARRFAGQSHILASAMRVRQSIMESQQGWDHTVGAELIKSPMASVVFRELATRLRRRVESYGSP